MSPAEHERMIASLPPRGYSGGQLIPCACCGAYFKTTDWPPAICQECRKPAAAGDDTNRTGADAPAGEGG